MANIHKLMRRWLEQPVISVPTRAYTSLGLMKVITIFPVPRVLIFQFPLFLETHSFMVNKDEFVFLIDPESVRNLLYVFEYRKVWSRRGS